MYEAAGPGAPPLLVKATPLFGQDYMAFKASCMSDAKPRAALHLARYINQELMSSLRKVPGMPQLSCQLRHQVMHMTMRWAVAYQHAKR